MISQLEFHSRAELCRQLARLEPSNKTFWMAEAESWSRLSKKFPGEARTRIGSGLLGMLASAVGKISADNAGSPNGHC
jgi:hypothetical protein